MVDADGGDRQPVGLHGNFADHFSPLEKSRLVRTEATEVRPLLIVEQMIRQRSLHVVAGKDSRAVVTWLKHIFEKQRKAGDVINVRMREEDVLDRLLGCHRRQQAQAPRIDRDLIVNQKRGQMLTSIVRVDT